MSDSNTTTNATSPSSGIKSSGHGRTTKFAGSVFVLGVLIAFGLLSLSTEHNVLKKAGHSEAVFDPHYEIKAEQRISSSHSHSNKTTTAKSFVATATTTSSTTASPTTSTSPSRPPSTTTTNHFLPKPPPHYNMDPSLVRRTRAFVEERRQVYEDLGLGINWHLRGIAYASEHLNLMVAGHLEIHNATHGLVRMYNVHPAVVALDTSTESSVLDTPNNYYTDCHRLTLWVRVRGPEIFAGKAHAQNATDLVGPCSWTFAFDLQVAGNYTAEAKLVLWDGMVPHTEANYCQSFPGDLSGEVVPQQVSQGFWGFKIYDPQASCCEICSRQKEPPCRYWSSPPLKLQKPRRGRNGCEFYFSKQDLNATTIGKNTKNGIPWKSALLGDLQNYTFAGFNKAKGKKDWIPPLPNETLATASTNATPVGGGPEVVRVHGFPHKGQTPYFLGCGWNQMFALDFPCVSGDLDDKVMLLQDTFTFEPPPQALETKTTEPIPLCTLEDELQKNSKGRWVKEPWPNITQCPWPFSYDKVFRKRFKITWNIPDHPHCWHRDDLTRIGHDCYEMNCQFIWPESRWVTAFREKQWMGVWRPYHCDYLEFTDAQLAQCMQAKKIGSVVFNGKSIADSYRQNVMLRLQHVPMYNGTDAKKVTFATLSVLHQTTQPEAQVRKYFDDLKPVDPETEIWYVATPHFLVSEREVNGHVERMFLFTQLLEDVVRPKGYHLINAFDLSTAMAYETAGQFDGMHLIGPAMKAVTVKLFHHLCADVVDGSRQ